ncbi:MAG: condensation domain-containing protein, partial [Polyangiaceae bacterium]
RPCRRDAESVTLELDGEATARLLREAGSAYRTEIGDLLLTALARALVPWAGGSAVSIELEGHGRETIDPAIDLSRTVGWFTAVFPVALAVARDLGENILAIKECLRQVPRHGIGFGVLAQRGTPEVRERLARRSRPRITFNYLGQTDANFREGSLFDFASESSGPVSAADEVLDNWIVIDGRVVGGVLRFEWTFARSMFHASTIRRIAESFERELRAIAQHCTSGASGVSPSDFPSASLSMQELRALPVSAREVEDIYPLTPLQQGILFHSLELRANDPYFYQRGFAIEGDLDLEALQRAWKIAARRYAALRTTFHWSWTERPMQIVAKDPGISFVEEDWRGYDRQAQWEELRRRLERERLGGFDFTARSAIHLSLLRVDDGAWWMVWSLHHLALDGWSTAIVLRDVRDAYLAGVRGEHPRMGDAPPFSAYVQRLAAADVDSARGEWSSDLAGFETVTPLPLVAPLAATGNDGQFADHVWSIEGATWQELRENAARYEVTIATMLQSAWALVLGFYAGERDVVFGVTTSGRTLDIAGVDQMVGLLIHTLPLRVTWSPDQKVSAWLRTIFTRCDACERRPFLPISDIQKETSLRDGRALFESIVVIENYPIDQTLTDADGPWRIELLEKGAPDGTFSKARNNYPLSLVVGFGDPPPLTLAYDTSRLDAERIAEIARQLTHVLRTLAQREDVAVGAIGFAVGANDGSLIGADRASQWSNVLEAWERNVAAKADEAAVYDESGPWTYRQIDTAASRLANRLRASGIERGDVVGLYFDRSRELVIAILAIWKARGFYLPIERRWPESQVERLIADAGARLVVCGSDAAEFLGKTSAQPVIVEAESDAYPPLADL